MQRWPVEKNAPFAAHSTAVFRSASSSTTSGLLPPISSWNFRMCSAEALATRLPVSTEPVKEIAFTSGLSRIACPTTEPLPMTRLKHALRQAGALQDVGERPAAARHEVGRLEDHRVAVGERRRDLPGGNGDRKIPRRDQPDDADRLALDQHLDVRAARSAGARRRCARASPAKNAKIWPARVASPMPSASVFPSSRDEQPAELLLARQNLVGGLLQDLVARVDVEARPGRRRRLRRGDGALGVGLRGARVAADHLVGVRGIDVLRLALAFDPFAGDQIVVQFFGHFEPRIGKSGQSAVTDIVSSGAPASSGLRSGRPKTGDVHLEHVAGLRS